MNHLRSAPSTKNAKILMDGLIVGAIEGVAEKDINRRFAIELQKFRRQSFVGRLLAGD